MASQTRISSPEHKWVRGLWVVTSSSKPEGHLTPKRKVPVRMPPPHLSWGKHGHRDLLFPMCLRIKEAGDCGRRLEGITRVAIREKLIHFQAGKW